MQPKQKKITDLFSELGSVMGSAITRQELQDILDTIAELLAKASEAMDKKASETRTES
jgi:hypothetical protein